ncbi:MAG: hypothetical protein AAB327_09575 [Actinomycetota bacterium]
MLGFFATEPFPDAIGSALAGSAALVACAFALLTFDHWLRRRRPHELAWSIAMALFTLASLTLWWAESTGWTIGIFRLFFLFGAVLNVPWLALGSIYLLVGKRIGDIVRSWLIAVSGFAVGVVGTSPTKTSVVPTEFPTGRDLFGAAPRILAAVGSGVPAMIIIAGALWSTWRVLRRESPALSSSTSRNVTSPRRLAAGNIVIAIGTLILSASGLLAGRLGQDRAFAITLLIGVCTLFAGFLVASNSTHGRSGQRTMRYLSDAAKW